MQALEKEPIPEASKKLIPLDKIKLIFGVIGAVFILCTVPIPTVRHLYVGGLAGAILIFVLFFVLALPDEKAEPGKIPESLASKAIWLVPNGLFIGVLVWYATICFRNSQSIQQGTMPDNWDKFGWVIYILLFVHLAIVLKGGKFACGAWLTMSFLLVFVTMQFIQADFFKTEGFHM